MAAEQRMREANQYRLLAERRFLPFFITQACGAFNDNLLKNVLVILVTYQSARWSHLAPRAVDQHGRRALHPALRGVLRNSGSAG